MESLGGMALTGRKVPGPAADLVELESPKGLTHTAIQFHKPFRDHPALNSGLQVVLDFLFDPGVQDLAEIAEHSQPDGAFLYPTGKTLSVAELLQASADMGEPAGARAGLELMYLVAIVLHRAGEAASSAGIHSHGGLTPWRILVRPDGQVTLIGYGLPQIDIVAYVDDESRVPKEDAFRYCPPERLKGQSEDVTSDLFALALIGFELITGEPLYNGIGKEIRNQATNATGPNRLQQYKDRLSGDIIEALSRAVRADPDSRYADANEFCWAIKDLLGMPETEGPSLSEVASTAKLHLKKGAAVMGGMTAAVPREKLAELRGALETQGPTKLPKPPGARPGVALDKRGGDKGPRWGSAPGRIDEDDPPAKSGGKPAGRIDGPSGGRGGDADSMRHSSARDALKARLKRGGSGDDSRRSRERDDEAPRSAAPPPKVGAPAKSLPMDDDEPWDETPINDNTTMEFEAPKKAAAKAPPPVVPKAPPAETKAPPAPPAKAAGAQALLERLRGSGSGKPATVAPAAAPAPAAPPPRAPSTQPVPAQREATPPPAAPPPAAAPAGPASTWSVSLDGAKVRAVPLAASPDTVGEWVAAILHATASLPTDLQGRVSGWYRAEQAGNALLGSDRLASLDKNEVVDLTWIPNRSVILEVDVQGLESPMRFQAPVGTAVPASSLAGHLVRWLGLPGDGWWLSYGGQALLPFQVLDDLKPQDGASLVVKR